MKIAIVGLGLIGGSVCKALKKSTFHHIMGLDADGEVCKKALDSGAIDEIITADGLNEADMTMLCLYPETIVDFVSEGEAGAPQGQVQARFDSNRLLRCQGICSYALYRGA